MVGYKPLLRLVVYAAAFVVVLLAYWYLVVPGYFVNVEVCSKACHSTHILDYKKISGPFWCLSCHGFGVRSEIASWAPFHVDEKLQAAVEEHGECLMCHPVPGKFHEAHLAAKPVVKCVDCHTDAYRGGHTVKPGSKPCVSCHNPAAVHPHLLPSAVSYCLVCHSERPAVDWEKLKPGKASYEFAASSAKTFLKAVGARWTVKSYCLVCHEEPPAEAHKVHLWRSIGGRTVKCLTCHKAGFTHGTKPGAVLCVECHKPSEVPLHELAPEKLSSCLLCHRGWAPGDGSLFATGKGCKGCHGDIRKNVERLVGLHYKHVAYYGCEACHKVDVKTHKEFMESAKSSGLCLKCHTVYGGLKPEAFKLAQAPLTKTEFAGFAYHENMVKAANGDCFKCHYAWGKPKLELVLPTGG